MISLLEGVLRKPNSRCPKVRNPGAQTSIWVTNQAVGPCHGRCRASGSFIQCFPEIPPFRDWAFPLSRWSSAWNAIQLVLSYKNATFRTVVTRRRTAVLSVPIDSETEKRLEALGAHTASAKSALLKKAIGRALEDLEDLQLAQDRLARPARRHSLEEVERDLALDD